jgi:predicted transposase YbfD/YdcC
LPSLGQRTRRRTQGQKTATQTRSSLCRLAEKARSRGRAIRQHGPSEHCLPHGLEGGRRADASRIRRDNAPRNVALLRRLALTLLRRLALTLLRPQKTHKAGVKARQKRAGWDQDDLLEGLLAQPSDTH